MKGPSIAVMLAGKPGHDEGGEEHGEAGLSEAKAAAVDASKALMHAVASKDAEGVYRAFRSLSALCSKIDDLEDSGESDDESEESDEGKDDKSYEKGGLKEDIADDGE